MGRKSRLKRERQSTRRLESVDGRATVFCDEAGFTGNNLLDQEQEVFAFAGVALTSDAAGEIVERTIADFGLQSGELKGSRMLKTEQGRNAITAIMTRCLPHARVVTHLKRYALACKFFEYIFEPALSDQNSVFYEAGFHLYISNLLFLHFRAKDASAEATFANFATFMREGHESILHKLFPTTSLLVDTDDPLQAIALFAMLNRGPILEEVQAIRGDGTTPNWVLDLTTTSLFAVLCDWGTRHKELVVYCDRSKPLETETDFLQAMIGRKDVVRIRLLGKERPYSFNLVQLPHLVNSREHPGIQLADVIASALARACQHQWNNELDDTERHWLTLAEPSLLPDSIWPNRDGIDPRSRAGFVNSTLLRELTNRCLIKANLFDGIQELIAAAHDIYPKYLADITREETSPVPANVSGP